MKIHLREQANKAMDESSNKLRLQQRKHQMQQLAQCYAAWADSERVLNLLRSQSGTQLKPITTSELLKWASTGDGFDKAPSLTHTDNSVERFLFGAQAERKPTTPAAWFAKMFPRQVETFGPAILESVSLDDSGEKRVSPLSLNEDTFGSILGGDKRLKHHVVFYAPEESWYFFDPRTGFFSPTTEAKLQILLSQYFIRCAQEMPRLVNIGPLFDEFRTDETLKRIIKRARALLAADGLFFSSDSPYKRLHGGEVHTRVTKQFVRDVVKATPGEVLPIEKCFTAFAEYCKSRQLTSIARKQFKQIVAEVIKEEFDVGVRNDLQTAEHKYQRGWLGLALSVPSTNVLGRN